MICNYNGKCHNLEDKEFFIVPYPKDDEQLTSWIVRTAYKHNITPSSFITVYFPRIYYNKFWERDIDIKADDILLNLLEKKSLLNKELIYKMTLKSYAGYLNEKIISSTRNNLILPLGNRARYKFLNGQKICPACIKEEEPYFKKSWRLSFVSVCTEHNTLLLSYCPKCNASITIFKISNLNSDFTCCYKCGFDFKTLEPSYVEKNSYVNELLNILNRGYILIDNIPIYSILYFLMLKQVGKIVCHLWKNEKYESKFFIDNKFNQNVRCILDENFTNYELFHIYKEAFYILKSKKSFSMFCKKYKLSKHMIFKDMRYVPFIFQEALF